MVQSCLGECTELQYSMVLLYSHFLGDYNLSSHHFLEFLVRSSKSLCKTKVRTFFIIECINKRPQMLWRRCFWALQKTELVTAAKEGKTLLSRLGCACAKPGACCGEGQCYAILGCCLGRPCFQHWGDRAAVAAPQLSSGHAYFSGEESVLNTGPWKHFTRKPSYFWVKWEGGHFCWKNGVEGKIQLYEVHVTLNVSTPDVRRTSNVTNGNELGGGHIAGGDINRVHLDFIFIFIFKPRKK